MEIKSLTSQILAPWSEIPGMRSRYGFSDDQKCLDSEEEWWVPLQNVVQTTDGQKAFNKWVKDNKIDPTVTEAEAIQMYGIEMGYIIREAIPAVAQYHVNYGLDLDDTYEYKVVWKDTPVYTRVESSEDFAMDAEFVSYADGILSVEVNYEGVPAGVSENDNHMVQFALQVSKGGKVFTSDYATFVVKDVTTPRIADPHAVVEKTPGKAAKLKDFNYEEHYRRGTNGIFYEDDGYNWEGDYEDYGYHEYFANAIAGSYVAPWIMSEMNTEEELAFAHSTCDTAVAYNDVLDLRTITIPHYTAEGEFCFKPSDCCDPSEKKTSDDEGYMFPFPVPGINADRCFEMSEAEMAEFGLHFEYEVVKNFRTGKPETDQANFVELVDGHIFKPRVYETEGTAAIGRTPIIRVKLMHGEDIINVAYIKVFISRASAETPEVEMIPRRDYLDETGESENVFHFGCDGDSLFTTVHDMNVYLYNPLNLDKTTFHLLYDSLRAVPAMKDDKGKPLTMGKLEDIVIEPGYGPVEGTHIIKWTLSPDEMWNYAGKEVSVIAEYYSSKNPSVAVRVLLKATVADIAKGIDLKKDVDYFLEYWTDPSDRGEGGLATRYNVMPAPAGDTIGRDAQMITDINTSFETYPKGHAKAGKIKINGVDSVVYYFCKADMEKITKIGDLNVKFFVVNTDEDVEKLPDDSDYKDVLGTGNGTFSWLLASVLGTDGKAIKGYEMQPVAVIVNGDEIAQEYAGAALDDSDLQVKFHNVFYWIKNDFVGEDSPAPLHVADTLINTGAMYAFISGKAMLCTEDAKPIAMTFEGKDHFQADILRPIEVTTEAKDHYVDGVDFGQKGSYISIEDLLAPTDWRKRTFVDYPNYWGYYGVQKEGDIYDFEVTIDTDATKMLRQGKTDPEDLKDGMYIVQVFPDNDVVTKDKVDYFAVKDPVRPTRTVLIPKNESGYLMYFNNGRNLTEVFYLYVKAKLHYGFGYFDPDPVKVEVKTTEGQGDVPPALVIETEPGDGEGEGTGTTEPTEPTTEPTEPTEPTTPAEGGDTTGA